MNIKICTPVTGETLEDFLSNLESIQHVSQFIELRVDYIANVSTSDIQTIKEATKVEAIFTCRKKEEGGFFQGGEEERIHILQKAAALAFDYIDVELSTIKEYKIIKKPQTKLIISYHNFEKTPSYWDMQSIIYEMNTFAPDILKIATMMKEEYESTKLYRLLTNKPHTEERIVIGMGEKGKMTRILGPLLGSYLTYAATEFGESAPGQLSLEELQKIYNTMAHI